MTGLAVFRKLVFCASDAFNRAAGMRETILRILNFNLADKSIWPQRNISVCVETDRVSIAYGRRLLSRIRIVEVRVYPSERGKLPQPESVASGVGAVLNQKRAATIDVALAIPKSWVMMRTVELPVAARENLSGVISFELDRLTPLSADDALYDFRVLGENEDKIKVLIAACRADMVKPYLQALSERGINVARLTTDLTAMAFCGSYLTGAHKTLFVHLGRDGYEACLLRGGSPVAVCNDSFQTVGPEARVGNAAHEIARMAQSAGNGYDAATTLVSVTDDAIDGETIKSAFPSARFLSDLDMTRLCPSGKNTNNPFTAVGAVLESLMPKASPLNLLTKGVHPGEKTPRLVTIVLFVVISAMAVLYAIAPLQIEQRRLEEIDRQLGLIKPSVRSVEALKKEVEGLEKEIATIHGFKKDRPMTLTIMKEVTAILPKTVWLTRMRITETTVDIEGYAASANEIPSKLEASPYFQKVEFVSPTFRDTRLNVDRFVIKMEIENARKIAGGGPSR